MPEVWQEKEEEKNCSYLALAIKHPGKAKLKSDKYGKLVKLAGPIDRIAWIAYVSDEKDSITKVVCIYSKKGKTCMELKEKLSRMALR
jgi:hypothetical protein